MPARTPTKRTSVKKEAPIKSFASAEAFAKWLDKNHETSTGIWLRIAKKASGKKSVTYPEAVELALIHGWIDGQRKAHTEETFIQKFTPRARRSLWSRINRDKVGALISAGRMKPRGMAEIERAQKDGRWESAYDSFRDAKVPPDLEKALKANPVAKAFFKTLSSTNRYAILWRLQTAKKAETRQRRLEDFVKRLEKGETFH
jgi:uncharacterized protein YdeI (YjbR/CyaY-like superfamily)